MKLQKHADGITWHGDGRTVTITHPRERTQHHPILPRAPIGDPGFESHRAALVGQLHAAADTRCSCLVLRLRWDHLFAAINTEGWTVTAAGLEAMCTEAVAHCAKAAALDPRSPLAKMSAGELSAWCIARVAEEMAHARRAAWRLGTDDTGIPGGFGVG